MALTEDIGRQDITTNFLVSKQHISVANIIAKEVGIVCGIELAKRVFKALDPKIHFHTYVKDGDKIKYNTKIASLKGKTRVILTGERIALNFLGHLSGIATNTNNFVCSIKPLKAKILDTRKTTPGLRKLEKYAVKCGGGENHRIDLYEMILVKDNHIHAYNNSHATIPELIRLLKKRTKKRIIIEVDTFKQYKQALPERPDVILLDNMTPRQLKEAVSLRNKIIRTKKKPLLEASGGINLANIREYAKTGVERISIGSLTHTHKAINFSMEVTN